jgi:GGDEF domain-containing protein
VSLETLGMQFRRNHRAMATYLVGLDDFKSINDMLETRLR